ncbi:MAG: DNA mismatch repair endonuclease MutL [Puniceicoccales bacterium]|jgi:DNA mismatch repair protein MutL|nr:DNA mismatch repair endonuclease MutL [Puniceicoccales bacterium]
MDRPSLPAVDGVVRLLPEVVINQVAAGEVVERPAAVVKELVENAIDGGATRIDVDFRRAGKDFLSVRDNGVGMGREDVLLAVRRHATSKINAIADLQSIHSFGFRGEALPSIAAVSHLVLRSRRRQDPTGTEIVIEDGMERSVADRAMEPGTEVQVRHLFQSVPARRKFLCTDATEAGHILVTVRLFAIAFPAIQFLLRNGNHLSIATAAGDSLESRLAGLVDPQLFPLLCPISESDGMRQLEGYLLRPDGRVRTAEEMLFFVNRRPIVSKELREWVLEAHAPYFPGARSIPCFLFLKIPPDHVDVNVHPAKREVRFSHKKELRHFLIRSLEARLAALAHPLSLPGCCPNPSPPQPVPFFIQANPANLEHTTVANPPPIESIPCQLGENGSASVDAKMCPPTALVQQWPQFIRAVPIFSCGRGLLNWQFVGRWDGNWAIWGTETGLVFFDIRAAAMRVAYERLLYRETNPPRQRLLLPIALDLRRNGGEEMEKLLGELAAVGFTVLDDGTGRCQVAEIPLWLREHSAEAFLYDWLVLRRKQISQMRQDSFAQVAASHIASSHFYETAADLTALLRDLMACQVPTTAPDGAGIYFEFPRSEMLRRLARPDD